MLRPLLLVLVLTCASQGAAPLQKRNKNAVPVVPSRPAGMRPLPDDPIDPELDVSRRQVVEKLGGDSEVKKYDSAQTELAKTEICFRLYFAYAQGPLNDAFLANGKRVSEFVQKRIADTLKLIEPPQDPVEVVSLYVQAVQKRAIANQRIVWPAAAMFAFLPGANDPKLPLAATEQQQFPWLWPRLSDSARADWANMPLGPRAAAVQQAMRKVLDDMIATRPEWGRSESLLRDLLTDMIYTAFMPQIAKPRSVAIKSTRDLIIEQSLYPIKHKDYADKGPDYERLLFHAAWVEKLALQIDLAQDLPGLH